MPGWTRAQRENADVTTVAQGPVLYRRRRSRRLPALAGLLALAVSVTAAGLFFFHPDATRQPPAAHATSLRPGSAQIPLRAIGAYDPSPGDGVEGDWRLAFATDGNPATSWSTERYASQAFGSLKRGVGIVLDAGRPVRVATVTVLTDTPGFSAVLEDGSSPSGPFTAASAQKTVETRSSFEVTSARPERYFVLWITSLPPSPTSGFIADVSEIKANGTGAGNPDGSRVA